MVVNLDYALSMMILNFRNCLFRALGDQYEGHSRNHIQLRLQVVDFIKKNRDEFEPFIEDDVPFDEHGKIRRD